LTIALSGCDCGGDKDETATAVEAKALTDGEPVEFVVDGPGVRYLYRTGYGGARSKLRLADVPIAYRGAVSVHVSGETEDAKAGEHAYLADLFGAKAGDEATAYRHEQSYLVASSRAGIDAARAALAASELAMETAEMTPGSEFRKHMRTTIVVEDSKTGQVERKQVSVKRGGLKRDEKKEKSWGDSVGDAWEGAFGDEAKKEAASDKPKMASWRPVVMYSTPWCPACKTAKRWLDKKKVPYKVQDVSKSQSARAEMQRYCSQNGLRPTAVPTFRIGEDNEMMQGWHAGRFERLAKK
jgi:glutaredoxin